MTPRLKPLPIDEAMIRRMAEVEGLSDEEIGRRVNRHETTVAKFRRRHGIQAGQWALRRVSATEAKLMRELHARGVALGEIARRVGRPYHTMYKVLMRQGLADAKPAPVGLSDGAPSFDRRRAEKADAAFGAAIGAREYPEDPRAPAREPPFRHQPPAVRSATSSLAGAMW